MVLMSWCPGSGCDPCKKPSSSGTLPPPTSGSWPTAAPDGYRIWFYVLGPGAINPLFPLLSTQFVLLGWGGVIYTPSGASAFGWAWPDGGLSSVPAGANVQMTLDFGGGAGGPISDGTGKPAQYSNFADAFKVAGQFSQYYYGY